MAVGRCAGGDRLRRPGRESDQQLGGNSASRPDQADLLVEREVWRVEASRGRAVATEPDGGGVFDLSFDWNDGTWLLVGCVD